MAATLELVIKGVDQASGTLRGVDKSAGGLAKTLGGPLKIGALAGVAALGSVVAIGLSFVKAAAEEEASIKRLAAAVDASGGSWKKSGTAIEGVIKQRQKLAFSDDELRSSLSLLVAITGDSDEALRRQTIAMDFARGANISLETASKLLGKVTDENVNVLGRYGIRVKEGADATELLQLVQQKFSGQSAAFADSTAGRWARVNIAFDNIKETIGMALLPTVSRLADKFATFLEEHEDDIEEMSQDFADFAEKTMPKVEAAAEDVAEALTLIADVVVPTTKALSDLDQMLDGELSKAFLNSLPIIREWRAAMNVKDTVQSAREDFKGFAIDVVTSTGPIGTFNDALGGGQKVMDLFGGETAEARSNLTDYTLTTQEANRLQLDLITSGGDAAGVVGNVGDASSDAAGQVRRDLIPGLDDAVLKMEDVQAAADETRTRLFNMFKEPTQEEQVAEAALANYRLELSRIEQGLSPLTTAQQDYLDTLGLTGDEAAITELMIGGLSRADAERKFQLETGVIPKTERELELLRLTRDAAKEQADVKYAQSPKLDVWMQKINDESGALDGLHQKMDGITLGGAPAFMGSMDGVVGTLIAGRDAATEYRDALYSIPTEIKTRLDLDIINALLATGEVGAIGLHAAGGVFRRATVGIIGEAGPEAVVPLNNPSRAAVVMAEAGLLPMVTSGGGTTVNINSPLVQIIGSSGQSPADLRRTEAAAMAGMQRALRVR